MQPLHYPAGHDAQLAHARQAQAYFQDRFPSREEFERFLRANLKTRFDEGSFYECSMSACGGGPVSEGYASDIDKNAPPWFRHFERAIGGQPGMSGQKLLEILLVVDDG